MMELALGASGVCVPAVSCTELQQHTVTTAAKDAPAAF